MLHSHRRPRERRCGVGGCRRYIDRKHGHLDDTTWAVWRHVCGGCRRPVGGTEGRVHGLDNNVACAEVVSGSGVT